MRETHQARLEASIELVLRRRARWPVLLLSISAIGVEPPPLDYMLPPLQILILLLDRDFS